MRNTQRDAPERHSGLLPTSKCDYPKQDVFMWFVFLFPSPRRRFTKQYNMPLLFLISGGWQANPFCTGALDAGCPSQKDGKGLHSV